MKKYNLSEIMKRAWEIVKKIGLTISKALKISWKEAKKMDIQEKLFEREQEITARKRELNDILRDSDEWSMRRPSPEIAAEQKKLNEELERIKNERKGLPTLTYYVANVETGKIAKITVDNNEENYHFSAKIRAVAKAIGRDDEVGLEFFQTGKIKPFESEKQAENYIKSKNQKLTVEDEERWAKRVEDAQKIITYDNY